MTRLLEFSLEQGGTVLIEVDDVLGGSSKPAGGGGSVIANAGQTLEKALANLKPVAEATLGSLRDLGPQEIQLSFGIKVTGEKGIIIAKAGLEANFNLTLTWKPNQPNK